MSNINHCSRVRQLAAQFTTPLLLASAMATGSLFAGNPYLLQTSKQNGRSLDEIVVPGIPPFVKAQPVSVPAPNLAVGINVLSNVPAFTWSYGCSATAAAMLMGYYDNHGFPNMYTGPANGGVCPMNNELYWGHTSYPSTICGECPLSATHLGLDGRTQRGHVDDYWVDYGMLGSDPCVVNGWTVHPDDSTADFLGTSQTTFGNSDGATTFWFYTDGSALHDYTGAEPWSRDGCHGLRLFANSRGYTVVDNFSQYIYGYAGNTLGFTYNNFKAEIDAGRPVLIQVTAHSMIGYGYSDVANIIYIHDTWDNSDHSMSWGGSYSGLQHYGVGVLRLTPVPPSLTITRSPADSVLISWPSPSTGWNLLQNNDLTTTNWTAVPVSPTDDGTTKTVIVSPPASSCTFYRLRQ